MFSCKLDDNIELRIHEERHADALWKLTEADRARGCFCRGWMVQKSVEDSRTYIKRSLYDRFTLGNGLSLGIWFDEQLVGGIGFHYFDQVHKKTEIGYWLAQWMEGRGIMTRCVCRGCWNMR